MNHPIGGYVASLESPKVIRNISSAKYLVVILITLEKRTMRKTKDRSEPHSEIKVFLEEIGEVVKEYLETKHKERRKIPDLTEGGEDDNESRRLLQSE